MLFGSRTAGGLDLHRLEMADFANASEILSRGRKIAEGY